ncbi:arginase family protein [Pigmentiphaga litoralis]|uniref:arginase family protein n=1 Tax=Pigmentiphaga litoralis TaxID=516702 RepID=UPI003B42E2E5
MTRSHVPVALDFDGSIGVLPGMIRIALGDWQESIRFGCQVKGMNALARRLDAALPDHHGTVLMGSGDFHHVSWPLIERQRRRGGAFRVVVFDNHPDNMRFPFGVHCGSWVRRVALMPEVSHVHVVGITSGDIGAASSWENTLAPLWRGKLTYWSVGVDTRWARWAGVAQAFRSFDHADTLIDAFDTLMRQQPAPTYVSIDKDVFSTEVVRTNWDQGRLLEPHVGRVIDTLGRHIVASDITGEVSSYVYRSRWKRWLSAADGQDIVVPAADLARWQEQQHALNARLVARIAAVSG